MGKDAKTPQIENSAEITLETFAELLVLANVDAKGIIYENMGCSDYVMQYKFRGLEFYNCRSEIERNCICGVNKPLTTVVKLTGRNNYYSLVR